MKINLVLRAAFVGIVLLGGCFAQNNDCAIDGTTPEALVSVQPVSTTHDHPSGGSRGCSNRVPFCLKDISCSEEPNSEPHNSGPDAMGEMQPPTKMSLKRVFLNLPGDQKAIWTAPFHLRVGDIPWVLPLATSAGILFARDRSIMLREHSNPAAINLSNKISTGGIIALAGAPAAMYAWGSLNGAGRAKETGLLAGEALINTYGVMEALKHIFGRERATVTDGQGRFFQDFGNPSFPSDHSMLSWTAASVVAHEYPGWLSQSLAYGTASAVSIARVTERKHFPSDVVIGGGLGWLIGRQVYNRHHDPELDEAEYGKFIHEGHHFESPQTGATYVPIDSWVYPELDRLAALGHIDTAEAGIRPWTRSECARLVEEAGQGIDLHDSSQWTITYERLAAEFAPELEGKQTQPSLWLEDSYTRIGFVSGTPLADDYHFAKTFTYDFGRPFGHGLNDISGASARAIVGPIAFYVRGEYQHAGTLAPLSAQAQQAIVNLEGLPFAPPQRTDSLDRFRLLDAYASFNFHNNVISFGNQTLWWGPGADGPFLASNNGEPLPMLRISRAQPFVLPWMFRWIGAIRAEAFWGQLEGQQFVALLDAAGNSTVIPAPLHPHPFIQGVKLSFKPTRNFEFGFGVTAILSGPGFPLTLHSLLRSYSPTGNTQPGKPNDPGDRRSAFDFAYRIPGIRDWLTFYGDSFTEDEYSPISFPRKSSFRAGLYAPRLPKLAKADLRVEGLYTDIPNLGVPGGEYFNGHYLSGYTNYGQIIGNAIGREGRGLNAWTTYHFNASDNLQFHYRNQHVNPEFLQGGYLRDFDLSGTLVKMGSLAFTGTVKYEHWNFPLLSTTPKTTVGVSLQISYQPLHGLKLSKAN
jgi:membrane-associated phospholipid phosphatase